MSLDNSVGGSTARRGSVGARSLCPCRAPGLAWPARCFLRTQQGDSSSGFGPSTGSGGRRLRPGTRGASLLCVVKAMCASVFTLCRMHSPPARSSTRKLGCTRLRQCGPVVNSPSGFWVPGKPLIVLKRQWRRRRGPPGGWRGFWPPFGRTEGRFAPKAKRADSSPTGTNGRVSSVFCELIRKRGNEPLSSRFQTENQFTPAFTVSNPGGGGDCQAEAPSLHQAGRGRGPGPVARIPAPADRGVHARQQKRKQKSSARCQRREAAGSH